MYCFCLFMKLRRNFYMKEYEQAVFISYAWGDEREEIVNQLDQALAQRGLKIIRDKRDLGYKGSINAFMERIGQGNCVIVVISDKFLRSPNCMFELVEIAEGKQFHDRIFPIVLNDADIYDPVKRLEYVKHWEDKLAELDKAMKQVGQANLQGIREDIDQYSRIRDKVSGLTSILKDMNTLTPEMHRESDFSQLYEGIMQRGGTEPSPISGDAPFMGLQYFDVEDASLFFGRTNLTDSLLEHINSNRFLAVVGASGSGKSSVVRAGVVASLKEEPNWKIHIVTPTSDPLETLALALTTDSESVSAAKTLREDMRSDPESLHLYARRLMADDSKARMLLVVDQFEELFTLCKDTAEREAYVNNLMTAVSEEKQGPLTVVLTLRADFYHHCMQLQPLIDMPKYQINIGAMTQDELRQSIEGPAKQENWECEPGLVDLMLRDVSDEPGALPLLSHALLATWQRRRGRTLTLAGYSDAGGVHGAIAKTAEDTYRYLKDNQKDIARSIFLRLTELGEGNQDTRRRVRLDELEQGSASVDDVLKVLADARLVTTGKDSVEVAHEALIREWPTLRLWLEEDREALRIHRHLTETAQGWERNQRDTGDFYRGTRLAQALEWAKAHADEMSPLEREYIKACQAEKNRERRAVRVRWASVMGAVAFGLMAVVLAMTGQLYRFIYRPLPMEWAAVPAGEFMMGSEDGESDESPIQPVYLDTFEIGTFEVTNEQYYRCVEAGACSLPRNQKYNSPEYLDHPVVDVSWFDAKAFCEWNDPNGRLPTEAEWEKAARGTDGRIYPWGEEIDCSLANYYGKDNGNDYCVGDTTPVGSYLDGVSPYGTYDMAGNVWEWVNDWYDVDYYGISPESNPLGPEDGDEKVLRGGSWGYRTDLVRSAFRGRDGPTYTVSDVGFRCASSP
jgi:formylglycine-generating enzyme required for sulfatase activity